MSLSGSKLNASIAVSDMARASEFYEGKLALAVTSTGADGSKIYESALHVYPSPANAGITTDPKGISPRAGGGKVAWFKDPDGNTFAVESD